MEQTIGTKASLKTEPRNVEPTRFSGGSIQALGEKAGLKPTPVPLQEFSKGTRDGSVQSIGQSASLQERSAYKGYESKTPMSERTVEQSK